MYGHTHTHTHTHTSKLPRTDACTQQTNTYTNKRTNTHKHLVAHIHYKRARTRTAHEFCTVHSIVSHICVCATFLYCVCLLGWLIDWQALWSIWLVHVLYLLIWYIQAGIQTSALMPSFELRECDWYLLTMTWYSIRAAILSPGRSMMSGYRIA